MLELCDLKMMADVAGAGTTTTGDHWPAGGIDEHIAQLDFDTSSIDGQSIFSSIAIDATLISTDSLDMEQLRQRCETNKNDYKLTFEDSGQWTTSGFGTATSPSGVAIHFEDLSDDQHNNKLPNMEDEDSQPNGNLTTWGRIRSLEPFDERTNSLPANSIKFRPCSSSSSQPQKTRPTSLLANFVERQTTSSPPRDYVYSETYLGDGRYVDLNENEIGYYPNNTAPIQRSQPEPVENNVSDRWQEAHQSQVHPPRRTFAELNTSQTVPDLKFLSLPFKVPSFCRSSFSLDELLRKTSEGNTGDLDSGKVKQLLDEYINEGPSVSSHQSLTAPAHLTEAPDSGLGSSSNSGPLHIEDWPSLSVLLPRHVVDACYFFKSNLSLLGGSSGANSTNNIERKSSVNRAVSTDSPCGLVSGRSACRTCFGVRNCLHPPPELAHCQKNLCDCVSMDKFASFSGKKSSQRRRVKLHAEELSIVGMPIYDSKRILVERVVEGVAEIARGAAPLVLYSALERLLSDGLRSGYRPWQVIAAITKPGRATSTIHNLVQRLEASEKPENSRIHVFFKELLRSHSLDGWLSYMVMKEKVLKDFYTDSAFVVRAHTAYRSLFWRLIESFELLSVLTQCLAHSYSSVTEDPIPTYDAARLASDSRVPKSSSVPSKLSIENNYHRSPSLKIDRALSPPSRTSSRSTPGQSSTMRRRGSRIPISATPPQHRSRSTDLTLSAPNTPIRSRSTLARVRAEIVGQGPGGWLPLSKGELVKVLSLRGAWARCCRLQRRPGQIINGPVPTEFLEI